MDKRLLIIVGVVVITAGLLASAIKKFQSSPVRIKVDKAELHEVLNESEQMETTRFKMDHPKAVAAPQAAPVKAAPVAAPAQETKVTKAKAKNPKKKKETALEKKRRLKKEKLAREKARRKKLREQAKASAQLKVSVVEKTKGMNDDSQTDAQAGPFGPISPPVVKQVDTEEAKRQRMLADLEYRLVNQPAMEDLVYLVKLYQAGKVNQQEYYKILNKMASSPNPNTRKLALQGASVQQNYESFQIIAQLGFDGDGSVQSQANQSLDIGYKSMSSLNILGTAMSQGNLFSKMKSVYLVSQMVQMSTTVDPNQSGRGGRGGGNGSGQRDAFLAFVPLLQNIVASGETNDLRQMAFDTLSAIERMG